MTLQVRRVALNLSSFIPPLKNDFIKMTLFYFVGLPLCVQSCWLVLLLKIGSYCSLLLLFLQSQKNGSWAVLLGLHPWHCFLNAYLLLCACQPAKCCRSCMNVRKVWCRMIWKSMGKPENENMGAEPGHTFAIGSGIGGLKTVWWRTLYLNVFGHGWKIKKIILGFVKFKLNFGSYFLVSSILGLLNHQPCSHFSPSKLFVLFICWGVFWWIFLLLLFLGLIWFFGWLVLGFFCLVGFGWCGLFFFLSFVLGGLFVFFSLTCKELNEGSSKQALFACAISPVKVQLDL